MASYPDRHDSSHYLRRYESSRGPGDQLHPNTYARPNQSRTRSYDHHRPSDLPEPNDRRHLYPQPVAFEPRRSTYPPLSRQRSSSSWPPQPFAEDERVSLGKEAGARVLLNQISKEDVPARGSIDQEPIILELQDVVERERRHSARTTARDQASNHMPTPPTSEDEKLRKTRRRLSKLNVDFANKVPEMAKRTSSPYSLSKTPRLSREISSNASFLSPGNLTPPPSDVSSRAESRYASGPRMASSRRDSARYSPSVRKGSDYFSAGQVASESAVDDMDTPRSASYSSVHSTSKTSSSASSRTSVIDFAPPPTGPPPTRRTRQDLRSKTDPPATSPAPSRLSAEMPRHANTVPLTSLAMGLAQDRSGSDMNSLKPGPYDGFARSRESSYSSSRPVSPAGSTGNQSAQGSVSKSTRWSWSSDLSHEGSSAGSRPTSRPGSSAGSRPMSPVGTPMGTPRLQSDFDWANPIAANAARRAQPPSRLGSSLLVSASRPDAKEQMTTSESTPYRSTTILPYPEDDSITMSPSVMMPSERNHQYFSGPTTPSHGTEPSFERRSFVRPPSPPVNTALRGSTLEARPNMPRSNSAIPLGQSQSPYESRPQLRKATFGSFAATSQDEKVLKDLERKKMPSCPRSQPVAGCDDWYTVIGAPQLDFCPDCVVSVFDRTFFRQSLRRSPPKNLKDKVGCAFGRDWIRLAWLFTLQQKRKDLVLLKDLMEVETALEPCPRKQGKSETWYGLADARGELVDGFRVCQTDVRRIALVMPTVSAMFVRLSRRESSSEHCCAMRTGTEQLPKYVEQLMYAHEEAAHLGQASADPTPFVRLVHADLRSHKYQDDFDRYRKDLDRYHRDTNKYEQDSSKHKRSSDQYRKDGERREDTTKHHQAPLKCRRDVMATGLEWYCMPGLPTLTVCEECFHSVVQPEIDKGPNLASNFKRKPQRAREEGMGTTCQLYSPRMRWTFRKAVETDDLEHLRRKSVGRRDAELRLNGRWQEILGRAKRVQREDGRSEADEAKRLQRELEKISAEWKETWE